MQLKPIDQQVLVLTGATSGMGLATARLAASLGTRLVLVARDQETLDNLVHELKSRGTDAIGVTADVTVQSEVQRIADRAIEHFGGFDTWVNLAGLTTYGTLDTVDVEDHRQLFEVNYWSVFYGSMVAARHLRKRGGAIINMGSILSDRAVPYQGTYCASKHAIKAFTDSLRMELQAEGAPISVSLIKPSSMDTPLRHHGKNYMTKEPENPPPAYDPMLTARAILHCAQHPQRDVAVGGGGKLITVLSNLAPGLADRFMARTMHRFQSTGNPAGPLSRNSLYRPSGDGRISGGTSPVLKHSPYTQMQLHPKTTAAVLTVGAGLLALAVTGKRKQRPKSLFRD